MRRLHRSYHRPRCAEMAGTIDESDMAEGLGHVSEVSSIRRIDLRREKTEVVAEGEQALEVLTSLSDATYAGEGADQPEAAGQQPYLLDECQRGIHSPRIATVPRMASQFLRHEPGPAPILIIFQTCQR